MHICMTNFYLHDEVKYFCNEKCALISDINAQKKYFVVFSKYFDNTVIEPGSPINTFYKQINPNKSSSQCHAPDSFNP